MGLDSDLDYTSTQGLRSNSDTSAHLPLNTQQGEKNNLLRLSPRKPRNMKNLSLDLTSSPSSSSSSSSDQPPPPPQLLQHQQKNIMLSDGPPPTLFRARTGSSSLPFRHPSLSIHNNNNTNNNNNKSNDEFDKLPKLQRRKTTLALTIPCKNNKSNNGLKTSSNPISDSMMATPISSLPEGFDSFNLTTKQQNSPYTQQQLTSSINHLSVVDDLKIDSFRKGAYTNGPICVLEPNLYLYSEPTLEQIKKFDIVINVAKELRDFTEIINNDNAINTNYIFIPWSHTTQICQDFPKLVTVIENGLANNLKILIHCQCGVSRSASLIVAFIMKYNNLNLNDAYNELKLKAPLISPNMTLIFQLMEWNNVLMGKPNNSNVSTPTSAVGPTPTTTNTTTLSSITKTTTTTSSSSTASTTSLFVPSSNMELVSSPTYSEVMN